MEQKQVSKVVLGTKTLIDLTGDTIVPSDLKQGVTAHDKSGVLITGTSTKDSDTTDATVSAGEMLLGKTGYARGVKIVGTMPNNGAIDEAISNKTQEVIVPMGFHDGTGAVAIDVQEQGKIIPSNIKQGVELLGVLGEYSGESALLQSKVVTPSMVQQIIQPDEGYDYLSMVTVNAIPYSESENSAGGLTVLIGG